MGDERQELARMESQEMKGRRQKVAVDCWFTSTGRLVPRMVKYEDEEGCLQTLRNICVLRQGEKGGLGIYSQRFDCRALSEGRTRDFVLIFHARERTWDMVVPV